MKKTKRNDILDSKNHFFAINAFLEIIIRYYRKSLAKIISRYLIEGDKISPIMAFKHNKIECPSALLISD